MKDPEEARRSSKKRVGIRSRKQVEATVYHSSAFTISPPLQHSPFMITVPPSETYNEEVFCAVAQKTSPLWVKKHQPSSFSLPPLSPAVCPMAPHR